MGFVNLGLAKNQASVLQLAEHSNLELMLQHLVRLRYLAVALKG